MAQKLVDWAVRAPTDYVLDPSFGGLVFLAAAQNRLKSLGRDDEAAAAQLLGVDLDEEAHGQIEVGTSIGLRPESLFHRDFFAVQPEQDLPLCEAVVGNPPYIRYQGWKGAEARRLCEVAGVHLTGLASSWAPFVIHSTGFVAPGGRLAMVLPGEMLHAQYAGEVNAFLRRSYARLRLVVFEQRVFPGALEEVVLLLAEGRGEAQAASFELIECDALEDLDIRALDRAPEQAASRPLRPAGHDKLLAQLLPLGTREAYAQLADDQRAVPLGAFGSVGIGAVTGDNSYFLLDEACAAALPKGLVKPAVSKAKHVQGIRFGDADFERLRREQQPMWMFVASSDCDEELLEEAEAYLRKGRRLKVHTRYKCKVRKPWYAVPIPGRRPPDLFLTYFSNEHPRLVLNEVGAITTNTLHGVHLRDPACAARLSGVFLNSLTLLSAELLGRSYGGGVLKLEPTEAQALLLPPIDQGEALAEQVDEILRSDGLGAVLTFTDRELLQKRLGLSTEGVAALRRGHEKLRGRRKARGATRV
jgi:adenine-specific DNA-methyltransferase